MTLLGCIADDFTGATDIAGLLARSGVRVSLRTGVPDELPGADTADFEVIALKTRTETVETAVAEARKALEWLRQAGATRFFWKYCSTFDSTAEGNIGPVADALIADIGGKQAVFCPAFPENGRRVFMGHLFVHQQLLSESPMKDHPLTPMTDSNVVRLLEQQVTGKVALADYGVISLGVSELRFRMAKLAEQGVAHVVVDAVNNSDLQIIAKACRNMPLITGGSAVAMFLPDLYLKDGTLSADVARTEIPLLGNKAVVLSGSSSSMTNRQVADYLKWGRPALRLDPLDLSRHGHGPVLDWLTTQDLERAPLIYATAEPARVRAAQDRLGSEVASNLIEAALAASAIAARDLGAQRIVVAGGETSGAVTNALAVQQMDVGPEIAPGVPWCFCVSDGKVIALTLKSGNFGADTFFSDALQMLEPQ